MIERRVAVLRSDKENEDPSAQRGDERENSDPREKFRQFGEHGRLVARAGADLEDPFASPEERQLRRNKGSAGYACPRARSDLFMAGLTHPPSALWGDLIRSSKSLPIFQDLLLDDQEDQDVAQALQIEAEHALAVQKVIIEVDPAVTIASFPRRSRLRLSE